MGRKSILLAGIPLLILILFSCDFRMGSQAAVPDAAPRFSRVVLRYNDTNELTFRQTIRSLDTFYQRQVMLGFNGSVLIGYKGKILYERYFGISQKESGALWSCETQSQLASTSKTLTGGAIMLLKDKGLLQFDDPVSRYLPGFPYKDITIRMLLDHRSGLADYLKLMNKPANKLYYDNGDVLNWFITHKPKQMFKTNTAFHYCNSNFVMLACIIESISGLKYRAFMKKFVFTPIGMDHTFVINPNEERVCTASFCYNYRWQLEPDMHFDGVVGDKGIYSTVQDLYRWDQALYSGKFIKQSTLNEAYTGYSHEKAGVKNYGLGWRILNYPDGLNVIYHNGWWHGNNTCFYRFIQDNFTIIILGNRFNKNIYHQPEHLFDIVMGRDFKEEENEMEE